MNRLIPIAGALAYPFLLHGYLAFAGVFLCALAVVALRRGAEPRGVLIVAAATPPVYVVVLQLSYAIGFPILPLWCGAWLLAAAIPARSSTPRVAPGWLRVAHGVAAAILLLAFIIAHLANHLVALLGVDAHRDAMHALRTWYRAPLVEPVVLTCVGAMIATGLPLVIIHSRDRARSLQTASGAYLLAFLIAHCNAVLTARSAGVETDWYFAGGGPGGPPPFLMTYYLLAVFAVVVHCALGLRLVLQHHGRDPRRLVAALATLGAVAATLIVAALCGLRIRS